jgi:quinolone resistance protein
MIKRVKITPEIFENKLKFYQNMSISTEAGNPFDFKNIDVNHAKVKGVCFRNCDFSNALFSNASFTDVTFIDCDLTGVKFSCAELANIRIVRGSLDNAQFKGSTIYGMEIQYSKIQNTRFDGCRVGTLRIAETKNYGRLRVNNCKVEYLDLGGSAPFEVSYLFLSMTNTDIYMFYAKRVSVKLDNPTNLKIGTLEPHQASFYPEKAEEVFYSMTDTILPDTQ